MPGFSLLFFFWKNLNFLGVSDSAPVSTGYDSTGNRTGSVAAEVVNQRPYAPSAPVYFGEKTRNFVGSDIKTGLEYPLVN
jgi:hypothetical protein